MCTVTTGSSIFGYSRTVRRGKLTPPTSSTSSDSTVAKTGRRGEILARFMARVKQRGLAGVGAWQRGRHGGIGRIGGVPGGGRCRRRRASVLLRRHLHRRVVFAD